MRPANLAKVNLFDHMVSAHGRALCVLPLMVTFVLWSFLSNYNGIDNS